MYEYYCFLILVRSIFVNYFSDFWGIRLAHYPYEDDSTYDGYDGEEGGDAAGDSGANAAADRGDVDNSNGGGANFSDEIKEKIRLLKFGANNNSRDVPCEKCGKWYTTRSIMLRHMNHECGVEKKVLCPLCNKRFRRKWNLEQHLKRVHKFTVPPMSL